MSQLFENFEQFAQPSRNIGVFAVAAIIACATTPPPRGSLYPPHRATAEECDAAQVTLDRLECRQRTHAGHPFAELCRVAAADSPARDWRPDCIALVTSCDQVEAAYAVPSSEKCR